MSSEIWSAKLRATRQLVNELRADVAAAATAATSTSGSFNTIKANAAEAERARRTAVTRRKLNRLDDLLDVLEDCMDDGARDADEARERRALVEEFQREARRLRAETADADRRAAMANAEAATMISSGAGGVVAAIGATASRAVEVVGSAAGDFVRAAESVPGVERAATMMKLKPNDGETRETRGLATEELIEYQTQQLKGQDDALDGLDKLVGSLKSTSTAIHKEVELQAKLVEDLEADFAHTSERMKQLRKQGFKLAGEKNEAERERLDRNEVIAEMQAKLARDNGEDASSCTIQ